MPSLTHERSLPVPSPAVVFQPVDDGAVLLHTRDEIYYGLNAVGVQVWQLLPHADSLDTICAQLGQRYPDVPTQMLRDDVSSLLDSLHEAGLVQART